MNNETPGIPESMTAENTRTPPEATPQEDPNALEAWGDAMSESSRPLSGETSGQEAAAQVASTSSADTSTDATNHLFKPLGNPSPECSNEIGMILDVPVRLTVELGRTQLTIKNLLQLGQGSVVELDGLAGEPMDIYVNGYLIAQGEVVVVDEKYGIRLTDIITPSERLNRLNSRH